MGRKKAGFLLENIRVRWGRAGTRNSGAIPLLLPAELVGFVACVDHPDANAFKDDPSHEAVLKHGHVDRKRFGR